MQGIILLVQLYQCYKDGAQVSAMYMYTMQLSN